MIGYLKGEIIEVGEETVIIEASGVGYEVLMPSTQLFDLQQGQKNAVLWIHTHVREDALTLFGFLTSSDKQFFLSLLKINGVGPKMALSIMSGASQAELFEMIEREDVRSLSKLPKVGKKTAEQMILALKGKLVKADAGQVSTKPQKVTFAGGQGEVFSALINLGYKAPDVEKIVTRLPKEITLQEGIRQSLQMISQGN